jgi:hypothetical protein
VVLSVVTLKRLRRLALRPRSRISRRTL